MQIEDAKAWRDDVAAILSAQNLPIEDLPAVLNNFLVAIEGKEVIGVIGLEIYGTYGLVRSLAVTPTHRNKGVAGILLNELETRAALNSLTSLYLLTETASSYFTRKCFEQISRDEVPPEVTRSSEFSHVCPVTAVAMQKKVMSSKNILVLCTGNSCRSQMAEGYLRFFAKGKLNVYSAGIETHGLNAKAVTVMAEDGIDISGHTSNYADDYNHIRFDKVITVCDNANEACPYFPGEVQRFHQNFPDPAKVAGTPTEVMQEFRRVRDMIKAYAADFITKNL